MIGRRLVVVGLVLAAVPVVLLSVSGDKRSVDPAELARKRAFTFGFAEDLPQEIGVEATDPARTLGATAFRFTLRWTLGQTRVGEADAARLDRALAAANGMRIVVAVYGASATDAPQDDAARDSYCNFVEGVLDHDPAIRDVIVWNEPNKSLFWRPQFAEDGSSAAPASYAALLARCWDILHAAHPGARVIGPALSAAGTDNPSAVRNVSHSPGEFIRKLGCTYRASGRALPIMDVIDHHPYAADPTERPWRRHIGDKRIGLGDWNKLMYALSQAFAGTAQPIPGRCVSNRCVPLWYSEDGFQTQVDAPKQSLYSGTENETKALPDAAGGDAAGSIPAERSPAPDQATQVRDAVRLAACQPFVEAYFSFLLADEPILRGWQSGALWADRTAKDSYPAFLEVIAEATSRSVDCASLKGGLPSADYMPPSAPTGLTATVAGAPSRLELSWASVTDTSSPVAYRVYREGTLIATTTGTSWSTSVPTPGSNPSWTVRAIDAAGNLGPAAGTLNEPA